MKIINKNIEKYCCLATGGVGEFLGTGGVIKLNLANQDSRIEDVIALRLSTNQIPQNQTYTILKVSSSQTTNEYFHLILVSSAAEQIINKMGSFQKKNFSKDFSGIFSFYIITSRMIIKPYLNRVFDFISLFRTLLYLKKLSLRAFLHN